MDPEHQEQREEPLNFADANVLPLDCLPSCRVAVCSALAGCSIRKHLQQAACKYISLQMHCKSHPGSSAGNLEAAPGHLQKHLHDKQKYMKKRL